MGEMSHKKSYLCGFNWTLTSMSTYLLLFSAFSYKSCHNFHLFNHFLLSSKCPNTHSNHDIFLSHPLSYPLHFIFQTLSHTNKNRESRWHWNTDKELSTCQQGQQPTRSPCWNPHRHPSQHQPRIHHEARTDQKTTNQESRQQWSD